MIKGRFIILTFVLAFGFLAFQEANVSSTTETLAPNQSVSKLLETFGDTPVTHKPKTGENISVERGKEIVLNGFSKIGGKKSKRQSKHFTCVSCHNITREDPDLANPTSEARLAYAVKETLPFLPGSPLYGIVNRTSFYNGDYEKKYGALVEPTRNNLREAIQLCAVECSQGRALKPFEMESILAYLWTIDLKLADLLLAPTEMDLLQRAFDTGNNQEAAVKLLKSKYLDHSPATFIDPPKDRQTSDGLTGYPDNGAHIYKLSCQYCHYDNNFSFLLLDNDKLTFQHLLNQSGKYTTQSFYQVMRYGTPPKGGKEAYMPQFTEEKLSNQQMADLRAYIESQSK